MTKIAATFAGVFWALGAIRVTNDLLLAIGLEESAAKIASVAGILVSVGIIVGQVRRICRWVDERIEPIEVLFEMGLPKRLDDQDARLAVLEAGQKESVERLEQGAERMESIERRLDRRKTPRPADT